MVRRQILRRRRLALSSIAAVACVTALFAAQAPAIPGSQAPRSDRGVHRTHPQTLCGLAHAAFCATFSRAAGTGNRSGELDGTVWGVSRQLGFNNLGQHQYDAAVKSLRITGTCPTETVTVETDIKICHGRLNEVVNDNPDVNPSNQTIESGAGTVTSLAMYPKQPFDFGGRTGKVVFDVSDDSGGSHAAWPEFWITSAPAPDPFAHLSSWQSLPQYGFGIRLDGVCSPGQGGQCGPNCSNHNTTNVVTVNDAIVVRDYTENDPENNGDVRTIRYGCVREPTKRGQLNHFQVNVAENRIEVYGTNPGTEAPLIHLATVPNADLGFTRGLIWLEDVHYNANKGVDVGVHQALHTFTWDNVGFDGPLLPRDLAFDASDSDTSVPGYPALINLGWVTSASARVTITIPKVTGIAKAAGGLLTFNFDNQDVSPVTLRYSLNGHAAHTYRWPFRDTMTNSPRTVAIPIRLSEVLSGTNHVKIWSDQDTLILSNVDLIMRGAGGIAEP
jgi:hypothetical protein